MRKEIEEGGRIPRGYGVAWRAFDLAVVVCYPFGLHLLVRLVRGAYWRLAHLRPFANRFETRLYMARARGHSEGRSLGQREGIQVGLREGWLAYRDQLLKEVEKGR
jgi:hypothetical protein